MTRETLKTARGEIMLDPHPATSSVKVTWSANSRIGELAVPILTELDGVWHPRSKAWYLPPIAIDRFRARLGTVGQ